MLTFIRRIVPQLCDAEELTQDTFIKAFRSINSFDSHRGQMKHWLLGIAYREALMHLRQQKSQMRYFEDDERFFSVVSDDEADRLLSEIHEQRVLALEEAVRRLPPEDRTLLRLYYNDGMRFCKACSIKNLRFLAESEIMYYICSR